MNPNSGGLLEIMEIYNVFMLHFTYLIYLVINHQITIIYFSLLAKSGMLSQEMN